MYIPTETVQFIQTTVPIEDVIFSSGYKVVGTGKSKGINICPNCGRDYTHIKINSNKNLFKCFSSQCNFKGNQFHWIMKVENLSFPDAVKRVAEIGGITINEDDKVKEYEAKRQKAFNLTLNYYRNHKHNYLNKRGIDEKTKEIFKVGFAPGGAALKKYLNENKFSNEFLLEIGLIRLVQEKKLMDRFYNSVIIPDIRNGKIYDFYARSVDPNIISKHQYLYGVNSLIGWQTVYSNKEVYIAEAPIDAMSLYQINNKSVFSIGGAVKFNHFHLFHIKKNNLKPIIALDNDEAGKIATIDVINLLKENDILSQVLVFDKFKDINSILQNSTSDVFRLIDSNVFIYNYQLSKIPKQIILEYLEKN